ncbi:hypothetical protein [Tepidibacter formicigenes]|jgi:nucleoside diphosphate kinase|uniref:Uncharacterized protein n=1 Tax=Tepidibacter formicigenes DSM 15518 TaxID=1123349 RepID=A0A1M6LDL2_9FIRM|nr:hypothetical protein [Tepidibacter formicigenes]SHJ69242.1 hypothetical protein SAMN02744037_00627 [Tepidibacter formicigenes DSM 15518]
MSRFLGAIHHWLFNKIRLYEELEFKIIENIERDMNTDISNMVSEIRDKIGNPIENKPLEELIDTNNIHGWLQSKITIAETRQAALITEIISKFKEEGLNVVRESYKNQAIECGKDAKSNYDVSTASSLYKTLNNYILDGMPCDNVNNITIDEENMLQWKVLKCLHKGYWNNVNGDINVLYELRTIWITNFIENANEEYKYSFKIEDINGQEVLVHEIKK